MIYSFNLNTSNEEMSDNEVALIKQVDDSKIDTRQAYRN